MKRANFINHLRIGYRENDSDFYILVPNAHIDKCVQDELDKYGYGWITDVNRHIHSNKTLVVCSDMMYRWDDVTDEYLEICTHDISLGEFVTKWIPKIVLVHKISKVG